MSLQLSEDYVSESTQILRKIGKHYEARVSILMPNGETLNYYGLSFDFDDDSREWHVSWIMSKARITELGSNPQFVLVSDLIFIPPRVFSASEVSMAAIPHEQLQNWRIRMIPEEVRSASIFSDGLVEDNCSYRINFAVPDAWISQSSGEIEQLRAKVLQATVSDSTSVVTIGKGPSLSYASSALLPSPVCSNGVQLLVSRRSRNVTCVVQKARFGLSSIRPADYWLDDDDAWISRPIEQKYLQTISGMQMTTEEKFISRSRGDENVPAFISLKETFICFFQHQGLSKFSLAFRGEDGQPDVQALIIHNGLRREHRHGTLVADLSICFLQRHFMDDILPWLGETFNRDSTAIIWSTPQEFDLFKKITTLFRMQGKNPTSFKCKPLGSKLGIPHRFRKHFIRALVPPLLSRDLQTSMQRLLSSQKSMRQSCLDNEALKAEGIKLVKEKKYAEAAEMFRKIVVALSMADGKETLDSERMKVECLLNIAFCMLQGCEDNDTAREVVICCDLTLEIVGDRATLKSKALYRKGLALEIQKKYSEAAQQFELAGGLIRDNAIVSALERVHLQIEINEI